MRVLPLAKSGTIQVANLFKKKDKVFIIRQIIYGIK